LLEAPNVGSNPHMRIEFLNSVPLRCLTASPIVAGEWNQFILKVSSGTVDCCIQGTCVAAAMEGPSEEALNFVMQDWYLGDTEKGVIGHVDSIKLKIVEDLIPGVAKKTLVYIVVCIMLFSILSVLGFKYSSDFLNPCGADSHSRTKTIQSDSSRKDIVQFGSSSWNKSQEGSSGTGGSGLPPPNPMAPPPYSGTGSRVPPPQPKLATSTSFNSAPPAAPIAPQRQAARPARTGLPSVKRQNTAPKRAPRRPPPRANPPPRPPSKKKSNREGAPPMIDLFS